MRTSDSLKELAVDLNKLQAEMPAVKMNMVNSFFSSKYADLGAVIETSKPLLAKYNFSIIQLPTSKVENGVPFVGVTTLLVHTSGEFVEDTIFVPIAETEEGDPKKKKQANYPQKAGIAISYLRRYAITSILGMYADEDTDGNTHQEDVAPEVIKARKDLKVIWDANPLLQPQYSKIFKENGYSNTSTDLKLIKSVISKLKEVQGEK